MHTTRLIRKRKRRDKKGVVDLDITSLLDILVILLVFLLKSFNSSGIIFDVPKDISIPISESKSISSTGVNIQVSPSKIWVDDKMVLNLSNQDRRVYDHQGRRIIPLFNELVRKKEEFKKIQNSSHGAKKFSGIVNLLVDKSLRYSYLKKLLYTSAAAGFKQYKFVVLAKE